MGSAGWVANKEGGAHVDPELGEAYVELTRLNSLGWGFVIDGVEHDAGSPVPVNVRQIAWELQTTIEGRFRGCSPAPDGEAFTPA